MIFLFRVRKLECVPSLCWMSKEVRETIREPKVMEKKDMINRRLFMVYKYQVEITTVKNILYDF